ncbi:MAG: hypothetical protein R2882_08085 [Gemmatimonadales bacterium]
MAYQDGNGPWTRITGVGAVYTFSITSPTAAFAYVIRQGGSSATTTVVKYQTRAEMSATPITFCPPSTIGTKIVNGSVTGLTGSQVVFLAMGGSTIATPSPLFPTYTLVGVRDGDRDLVAYRFAGLPGAADRVIIRRDLNLATGGSIPALDFAAAEAETVASAPLTVAGLNSGDGMLETMTYLVRPSCDASMMYQAGVSLTTHPMYGVPAAKQRADDYHLLRIDAATATFSRRVEESFQAIGPRTITLGGSVGSPAVTVLPGAYKRLSATFGFPLEYTGGALVRYLQTTGVPRIVELWATAGWIANTTTTMAMPEFTGITGWDDTWGPGAALTTPWTIRLTGGDETGFQCRAGYRSIIATATGSQ